MPIIPARAPSPVASNVTATTTGTKGKKGKKGEKGAAADPSVSHVTAELDRSEWSANPEMAGLSPAARLARQHTLKSNAEAAAKAKAEAEARAAAQAQSSGGPVPTTWEKNTTTRQGDSPAKIASSSQVTENGVRVVVEHDDSDSDDGRSDGHDHQAHNYSIEGWEDDEDWGEGHEDEDVTIRQALDNASLDGDDPEMEPWAINVRRSVERTRVPARGILKSESRSRRPDDLPAHSPHLASSPPRRAALRYIALLFCSPRRRAHRWLGVQPGRVSAA